MNDNICGFCIHADGCLEPVDDSIDDIFCTEHGCVHSASAPACKDYVDEEEALSN